MKLNKDSTTDLIAFLGFIMFMVAIAYLAEGRQSMPVFLFALVMGIFLLKNFLKITSKYLEEYYWNKREKRNREELSKQRTI